MWFPVSVFDVVHIVGRDDLEVELSGDLKQVGDDAALLFNAVIHDLDDEIVFAKYIDELGGGCTGFVEFALQKILWNDRREAA